MASARFAAVLLVVLATALSAQPTSTGQVAITVVDPSGAFIPGATVGILPLPVDSLSFKDVGWRDYAVHAPERISTSANASGEATVSLARGSFAISITAPGFVPYVEELEVRDGSNRSLRVTLVVGGACTLCVTIDEPVPLESSVFNILIPLEPLRTITLKAIRGRRR